jgi:cadmium resistance protein CadD (predicted permease)
MPRFTRKQYRLQMAAVMTGYIVLMLLLWPYARHVASLPRKAALTLLLVLPIGLAIWLMAKLVMHSDELEQRVRLLALSTATAVVAALSMAGGFLCAAGVFVLGGDILLWVFPALCLSYATAYALFARRYGGLGCG